MTNLTKLYYLEVVTPDVEKICASYSQTMGSSFGDPIAELGGARTTILAGEVILGIRAPMHAAEEPTTRPYYLVADIEKAVDDAKKGELKSRFLLWKYLAEESALFYFMVLSKADYGRLNSQCCITNCSC